MKWAGIRFDLCLLLGLGSWAIAPLSSPALSQALASERNPFGVMLPSQLVRSPGGIQVAHTLGAVSFRPTSVFLDQWDGSCVECDIALNAGLQLVLTVRASGPLPAAPPADLAAYQRTLGRVLDTYRPVVLAVENEENSSVFYTGTPGEYAAQLQAACQVAHQKGIPCTNGGLVSTLVALLVYDHYRSNGELAKAQDFAFRAFPPDMLGQLDSPQVQEQIQKGKALLAAYPAAGVDYVNFHWYIADTGALGEAVAYLRGQTGLPVITNEVGQTTDDPTQTRAVMGKIVELGLPVAVWFGLDGPKARGLVNLDGSLRPTGEAFRQFIAEHFSKAPQDSRRPRRRLLPANRGLAGYRCGVSLGAHRDAVVMPRSFELAGEAGLGWVRFGIWYAIVNPAPGIFRYQEAGFDAQVSKARQEGLEILGTLAFATQWNTSAPPDLPPEADPTHFPPRDYQAWADYVYQTISRYKNEIQYWEVWNEPDLRGFWAGTAAQYAELLAVTYDAVKRANPDAKIVMGGLALDGPPQQLNPNFLTEILSDARYPAARYFDIMNFHHYGTREEARQKMQYVRNALAQVGAWDKAIWITETGYSSDFSEQRDTNYQGLEGQAQWLRDMLPYLLNDLGADKVFWYRLYDYPADFNADIGFRYYGLIDNLANPKPSYFAYRQLLQPTQIK